MKTFFGLASLALASGQESLQDEVPSLLQLRATHDHHVAHNLTASPKSGHNFGCTGREIAQNVVQCGLWGDVHQHMNFQGHANSDSYGTGWFWLAKSQDGEFQVQGHYRQSNPSHAHSWTTLSHFALKFGPDILFMDRVLDFNENNAWMWKYYWNGQERSYTETPDIQPLDGKVTWLNRGSAAHQMTGRSAQGLNFGNIMQAYDARRHNCFEYKDAAVWISFQNWQNPRGTHGPYGQCGIIEIEGKQSYLNTQFGQCSGNEYQQRVDPADMLVTQAQNQKVCDDCRLTADQCIHPPPPPPTPPTAEELCNDNGFPFANAQALCDGQLAAHGQDIYDGCIFDVCASADENTRQNAEGGAELEAAMGNSRATCVVKPFGGGNNNECKPCNICWDAIQVDLTDISCNNLGGQGPDTSCPQQELRYRNAINMNGRNVDVVLTVSGDGTYSTPRAEKNGNKNQFGRFTVATNSNSQFKFSFVDSNTGEAVSVPDLALTFYDMDEANNKAQRETVGSCEITEAYVTDMTELIHTIPDAANSCHNFQSSTRGTGKDNPQTPDTLSMSQADRSVTFEYHARASIEFTAAITGTRYQPRPILFSFAPQVACGASDSQVQCAATRPR